LRNNFTKLLNISDISTIVAFIGSTSNNRVKVPRFWNITPIQRGKLTDCFEEIKGVGSEELGVGSEELGVGSWELGVGSEELGVGS
jgi:hypothetical protein